MGAIAVRRPRVTSATIRALKARATRQPLVISPRQSAYEPVPFGVAGHPIQLPTDLSDLPEAYSLLATVYAGVFTIAHSLASVPLNVYRRRKSGKPEVLPGHELNELLDPSFGNFNSWCTSYDGWEEYATNMELSGNAYWWLKGGLTKAGGPPEIIQALRPDRVRAIPDSEGRVLGWKYGTPGDDITLDVREVLQFKYFNPSHPILGHSSLLAAKKSIFMDLLATEFNIKFFRNGATIGGVVKFTDDQDEKALKRVMEKFNESHQGASNFHRWRAIAGAQELIPFETSHKDMSYYEGLKFARENILMCLDVPPAYVTLMDSAHYNNWEVQTIKFWNGIMAKLRKRDAALNGPRGLAKRYGPDIFVMFDRTAITALKLPLDKIVAAGVQMSSVGSLTPNELREWVTTGEVPELEPLEGGDEVYQPYSFDLGDDEEEEEEGKEAVDGDEGKESSRRAARPGRPAPRRRRIESAVEKTLREVTEADRKRRAEAFTSRKNDKAALIDARVAKGAPLFESAYMKILKAQEASVLANIARIAIGSGVHVKALAQATSVTARSAALDRFVSSLADVDALIEALKSDSTERIEKAYQKLIERFGIMALKDLGDAVPDGVRFRVVHDRVLKHIAHTATNKITKLDATTAETVKDRIRSALAEAQLAGDNIVESADKIIEEAAKAGFQLRRERANAIARTETTGAYNYAELESWTQSTVVSTKVWATMGDDLVRPSHAALDGQEIDLTSAFNLEGRMLMYPGDPAGAAEDVANCRCHLQVGAVKSNKSALEAALERIERMGQPINLNGSGANG